jgi:anaerobic ribonucleoside-triphosphate reductase activating protein
MLNGDGLRVVLWVSGCTHCCDGCQNPETWEVSSGIEFDKSAYNELFEALAPDYISGITFSGGDPLHPLHIKKIEYACNVLKSYGFSICIYTGHKINYVKMAFNGSFDFVKCGCYIEEEKQISGKDSYGMTLASRNQNFYNGKFKRLSKNGKLVWRKK